VIKTIGAAALLLAASPHYGSAGAVENPHRHLKAACEKCHTTSSWTDVRFHHEGIGFDLDLSHENVDCRKCHDISDFSLARPECVNCHKDVHESRLGTDCERCHTPLRWEIFDNEKIHAETRYPLPDRHILVDCRNCHPNLLEGDYATSASECIDCHERDYLATDNPGHVSLGLGTACTDCHETVRWRPAFFPSHDPIFPIFTGTHSGTWGDCSDCHPDPSSFSVFSCFRCHSQAKMDREHGNMPGYSYDSQSCLGCHPSGSAEGGIANHDQDYFPIYSGTHSGTWNACSDCHNVSGDFSTFTCLSCHEHDQNTSDGQHQGIPGYSYDSNLCYSCHPTGEGGDFLDHDPLYFPIYSGKHQGTWDDCTICHTNTGDWSIFSCITCHEHSRSEMDDEHREVQGYVYDSQACYDCHPDGEKTISWKERHIER